MDLMEAITVYPTETCQAPMDVTSWRSCTICGSWMCCRDRLILQQWQTITESKSREKSVRKEPVCGHQLQSLSLFWEGCRVVASPVHLLSLGFSLHSVSTKPKPNIKWQLCRSIFMDCGQILILCDMFRFYKLLNVAVWFIKKEIVGQ